MLYEWEVKYDNQVVSSEEVLEILIKERGIDDKEDFFHPSLEKHITEITQIFDSTSAANAINMINTAIGSDTPIVVHGDYDADGICATSIMWETLYRDLGYKNVHPFVPHREEHGYGVSTESVDAIVEKYGNDTLVITVDCGITAKDSIAYGEEAGLSFIITDHHTIQEGKVPEHVPVLHTYKLCGAGIAWAFSLMLRENILKINPKNTYQSGLDLAALATIADIQSVLGYNRAILYEGLPLISHSSRVGVQELLMQSGLKGKDIGVYEVGWVIAPRLNALGRLEHALDSVRLLLTTDQSRAADLVQRMDDINTERQELTQVAVDEAIQMVLTNEWGADFGIVLANDTWHEGILGLIAGRLVERFYVPVIVLGKSGDMYKGSARSITGCNVIDAIKVHDNLLLEAGGHAMAAGLSISTENVEAFRSAFNETIAKIFNNDKPKKTLTIDLSVSHEVVHIDMVERLQTFAPHGVDNPKPNFLVQNLRVVEKREVGKEAQHVSFVLATDDDRTIKAIWFNQSVTAKDVSIGDVIQCVGNLEIDTYREPQVQLKIKDISIH